MTRTLLVPAGKCSGCHQHAERLWLTYGFDLLCAGCAAAWIDALDLEGE